jgi:hypothetical protein
MDKGQKEYEAHVASQKHPERFHTWAKLPAEQKAAFVPVEKPKKAKAKAKKK